MKLFMGLMAVATLSGCGAVDSGSEAKDITNIEYMSRIDGDRFRVFCDDGSREVRTADEIAKREVCDYDSAISNVFRLEQDDTHLKIFARDSGKLIQNWYKHDKVKIFGAFVVLVDADGEALVFEYKNGQKRVIVEKWYDVVEFEINNNYVTLLDSARILDMYRISDGKRLVHNWKNVVSAQYRNDFVVLLDDEAERNLEVFDVNGKQVFKRTGVVSVSLRGSYGIEFKTSDGRSHSDDMRHYLNLN